MTDKILSQLDNIFKGMKAVIDAYRVVQPYFLITSTEAELRDEADKFAQRFSEDVSQLFRSQLLSGRNAFRSK